MKKWLFLWLLPLSSVVWGQQWDQDLFNMENNPSPLPFAVSTTYLDVGSTHFRTPGLTEQALEYKQWDAVFTYTHPVTDCSGCILGAGWIWSEVIMEDNFDFEASTFNYVNLSAGVYTSAFPDWMWTWTVAAYLDMADFSFIDYALYQTALWGRYDMASCLELDFGLIVEVGLRKEKVWPILGFVFLPWERWRISVVYPTDISIAYELTPRLTTAASIRFLRNRHRVGQNELNPQAIFEYRTTGVELDLTYNPCLWLSFNGFAGSTLNGNLQISNRDHDDTDHFKFKGSVYGGLTVILMY